MKSSEVFRTARNVLFERGWYQGDFLDDNNQSVCVAGACMLAYGLAIGQLDDMFIGNDLQNLLYRLDALLPDWENTAHWNDEHGRTFSEIIELLELAEKQALIEEEHAVL